MITWRSSALGLLLVVTGGGFSSAQPVPNVPFGVQRNTIVGPATTMIPFIGLYPCRIADTRGNGFTGAFGPPSLGAGAPRNFPLAGTCGIPAGVNAVSLNVTVTNPQGPGFILIYPQGTSQPLVSTLNYLGGQTVANSAIVPVGFGTWGITVVAGVSATDLILDVNGYFSNAPESGQFLRLEGATLSPMIGVSDVSSLGRGISGVTKSPAVNSAGVYGSADPVIADYLRAGVRGESPDGYGVLGLSQSYGVGAALHDVFGNQLAYGILAATGPTIYGVYAGGNFGGTGAKYFIEPHPTDASKVIRYVSLEGPEAGTYFRGKGKFQDGAATINVPEDFRMVTDSDGLGIQVTPIGDFANVAVVRIGLDRIVLKASKDVAFFYLVNGIRRTHRDLTPIGPGDEFVPRSPDAKMPLYLTQQQKMMLISNGTYKADGTVNLETARRLGWDRIWEARQHPAGDHAPASSDAGKPENGGSSSN
jgi:hypothetical protein